MSSYTALNILLKKYGSYYSFTSNSTPHINSLNMERVLQKFVSNITYVLSIDIPTQMDPQLYQ
jgi:hypothetical protein